MGGAAVTPNPDDLQPGNVADNPGVFMPPTPNPSMQGQQPQMPPDQPQQVTQAPGAGIDPELAAAAVHHGRLADILDKVGGILGGNSTLRMTKNSDGSISVEPGESTTGEKWGRVAAAALSGAAKGFAVGQGPGGAQRAAAAGIQSGMAQPGQQRDQTLALAEQANNQNRQALLFKANMAKLNQDSVASAWNLKNNQIKAGEGEEDRAASIQQSMDKMGAKRFHVADMEDTANAYNGNPELQQAHHDGRTLFFKTFDGKGNVNGGDIYVVPEDKMDQKTTEDWVRQVRTWDGNSDHEPTMQTTNVPKGSMTEAQKMTTLQADEAANNKLGIDYNKATGIAAQAKATQAEAAATRAQAAETAASNRSASAGTWQLQEDKNGNPIYVNDKTLETRSAGGAQRLGTADKREAALEKQIGPARDSLNYAQNYLAAGHQHATGSGDEALMEKYFDLAKPSQGFRMTQAQQDMLKQSRSMYDSIKARGQHLLHGTWFDDNQRAQIVGAMTDLARSKEAGARHSMNMEPGGVGYSPTTSYTPGRHYMVQDSDGHTIPIDGANMSKAWQADPNLQVLGVQ